MPSLAHVPPQHSDPVVQVVPTDLQHVPPKQLGESKQRSEPVAQFPLAGAQHVLGFSSPSGVIPSPQMVPLQQSPAPLHDAPVWPQHVPLPPHWYPVQQL